MRRARTFVFALALIPALALPLAVAPARAQFGEIPKAAELVKIEAPAVRLAPGAHGEIVVHLKVRSGWHINAHPAASENSIPTDVVVTADAGISTAAPAYPPPHIVKLPIDDEPLWVWDGDATLRVPISASATPGAHTLAATLKFQACNDQVCLPPVTVPFSVQVNVGAVNAATPTTATPTTATPSAASSGFATAAPAGASKSPVVQSPLAGVLDRGGWTAFLTLFLIGLALNLTPCVYPMIGVTVSIFGARRAAPPAQVFGLALLYVLGMATMYSALGLAAAFTGSLFGGWLSQPPVAIGIGLLLIGLSLSMFGLYEFNLPPALLMRVGGTGAASAAGVFLSGLVVGIFAAPCVGPPIVALLAVVGQRGDPWFGFLSFFTLAMGLGAPYLVLGTFSNLMQSLPRSGEWMVWVKKVFGLVLFGVGLNYVLLAAAPTWAMWVLPLGLVIGGLWLGFFAASAATKPRFRAMQRALGAAAVFFGVWLIATAPRAGLEFAPLPATATAIPRGEQPVAIDFSADWCQPCHELERITFTDPRVMRAMVGFRRYKVDLTRYDSPEAERWRREFHIAGVPTVVFLAPGGAEVTAARVEGFVPPTVFLERAAAATH